MKTLIAAVAALLLAACAPMTQEHGVGITEEQISQFQVGEATSQDVLAALGKPTATQRDRNGSKLIYSHVRTSSNVNYLVPAASKTAVEQHSVIFQFDPAGVLEDVQVSDVTT